MYINDHMTSYYAIMTSNYALLLQLMSASSCENVVAILSEVGSGRGPLKPSSPGPREHMKAPSE